MRRNALWIIAALVLVGAPAAIGIALLGSDDDRRLGAEVESRSTAARALLSFGNVQVYVNALTGGIEQEAVDQQAVDETGEPVILQSIGTRRPLPMTFVLPLAVGNWEDLHQAFRQKQKSDGFFSLRDSTNQEIARYSFTQGWISRIELHSTEAATSEKYTLRATDWQRTP